GDPGQEEEALRDEDRVRRVEREARERDRVRGEARLDQAVAGERPDIVDRADLGRPPGTWPLWGLGGGRRHPRRPRAQAGASAPRPAPAGSCPLSVCQAQASGLARPRMRCAPYAATAATAAPTAPSTQKWLAV